MSCTQQESKLIQINKQVSIDIQGHRGCRGLLPENSIPGFIKALNIGVTTLEMDVVISKDKQVVLSHDPFLSHEICIGPNGEEITIQNEKEFNLYEMDYNEIKKCDCGRKPHPRFPLQQKMNVSKPMLSDVIDTVENFIAENNLKEVFYNIETKSTPEGDSIFHPFPEEFSELLVAVIKSRKIEKKVFIQSFDPRTLQHIRKNYPEIKLALLVENDKSPDENLSTLSFVPEIYSPDFNLVNKTLVSFCKEKKMSLIPWTVNETSDITRMLNMGADGIISDYPDRVVALADR